MIKPVVIGRSHKFLKSMFFLNYILKKIFFLFEKILIIHTAGIFDNL